MHPDLLNNSIFLRYYNQWQQDPTSIVFAPIAEYLQIYGLLDEAVQICMEGLKHHPQFVSGRLALAKAYFKKKEFSLAKEQLQTILKLFPNQGKALELLGLLPNELDSNEAPKEVASWETLTMAKIYAAQGHRDRAREVYAAILKRDPSNEEALKGLKSLGSEG